MTSLSEDQLKVIQRLFGLLDNVQILIDQVPDQFPISLPLISEAQLVGSFVIKPNHFQVLFDVSLPIDQAQARYREYFLAMGWQEQVLVPPHYKGFLAAPKSVQRLINQSLKFRHALQDVEVALEFKPLPNESQTTLRLICAKAPESETLEVLNLPPFAPLEHPLDVEQINSSGSNSGGFSSHAHVLTSLQPHDLLSHYSIQFEQNGWSHLDSGKDGALTWRSWIMQGLSDQDWIGLLNIIQLGGVQNQFMIYVRVQRQA